MIKNTKQCKLQYVMNYQYLTQRQVFFNPKCKIQNFVTLLIYYTKKRRHLFLLNCCFSIRLVRFNSPQNQYNLIISLIHEQLSMLQKQTPICRITQGRTLTNQYTQPQQWQRCSFEIGGNILKISFGVVQYLAVPEVVFSYGEFLKQRDTIKEVVNMQNKTKQFSRCDPLLKASPIKQQTNNNNMINE
ncbi:Hypothetical_protein [Hexamita inflata]|uniref:Hypothetical_protein n=1 Tax=Hexamita inflata TaxID=28002 RepID=A0AA86TD47_9EUKA|nr:Hypothetical protein HINF_LOCUS2939 [Hexamita inflata]